MNITMSSQIQIRRNLLFNIVSLLSNIIIGVLYTPYLVKNIGMIAYGIIPLALIINQYITVITGSLTSSLSRFYTIAIQKNNFKDAEKYMNTSLGVISLVIVLLIIPSYFFVKNIGIVFNIPINLLESTKYLFSFTLISFSLSLFSSILNISLYAYNRLDLLNIVKILRVVFKFLLIILLFNVVNVNLIYVGLANLFSEVIVLIFSFFSFYFFNKKKIKIDIFKVEKEFFYVLIVMASWVMIQQIGDTMIYRIDSVFINKYWSTKETGIIGAFSELGTYAISISAVIGSLFGPLILQSYSKDDHETVVKMTLDSSLVVGILVAIFIGIICGFSPILINIWLGNDFLNYDYWLYSKLFLIPFYASAGVFAFTTRAWNKVKFPAIVTV
ncbi:MAG TPA: hypothetical protein DEG63_04080, partial [Flavobacteriaceae bacterium]|nr:hypothetical protein [Flavobacteriaceae bacterium]